MTVRSGLASTLKAPKKANDDMAKEKRRESVSKELPLHLFYPVPTAQKTTPLH